MKIKPAPQKGKVIVELESKDEAMLKPLPIQLQRILVPVDFSDTARKALQYALPFATAFGAELVLVHVMQPYTLPPETGYLPPELAVSEQELVDSARGRLDKLRSAEIGTRARSQTQVRVGVPWYEIVSAAGDTCCKSTSASNIFCSMDLKCRHQWNIWKFRCSDIHLYLVQLQKAERRILGFRENGSTNQ